MKTTGKNRTFDFGNFFLSPKEDKRREALIINSIKQSLQRMCKGKTAAQKKLIVKAGNMVIRLVHGDRKAIELMYPRESGQE